MQQNREGLWFKRFGSIIGRWETPRVVKSASPIEEQEMPEEL
jgi:hypothetical protein